MPARIAGREAAVRRNRHGREGTRVSYAHSTQQSSCPRGSAGTHSRYAALLTGAASFIDDLELTQGALHAAFVRSPIPHGRIASIDHSRALSLPGVSAVVTGAEISRETQPLAMSGAVSLQRHVLAVDHVRYVGDPVALVCAETAYLAEDAASVISVEYEPAKAVVDPAVAMAGDGLAVFEAASGDIVVSDQSFTFGDPAAAFARADKIVAVTVRYPRIAVAALERHRVIAEHDPDEDTFTITTNVRCHPSLHAQLASALRLSVDKIRLQFSPSSAGGSGASLGLLPVIVALCVSARRVGRPIKWIDDRLEPLVAASAPANSVTELRAAVRNDGLILGLDWDLVEDYGALPLGLEPGTSYALPGSITGPYRISHVAIRHRAVLTNKAPAGNLMDLGGASVSFALERVVAKIARSAGVEHLDVIARNLIASEEFPYRTASGSVYQRGNYELAIEMAEQADLLPELRFRRDAARAAGRLYGVGMAAVVAPSCVEADEFRMPGLRGGDDTSPAGHAMNLDLCGVQIDPATGRVEIDRYVTIQDSERSVDRLAAEGHIRGAFARGVGTAFHASGTHAADARILAGMPTDYAVPTAVELPAIEIHHIDLPSSAVSMHGADHGAGVGMSTPAALASAVTDALNLDDIDLPVGPATILDLLVPEEPLLLKHGEAADENTTNGWRAVLARSGPSSVLVAARAEPVWAALHDPHTLRAILATPELEQISADRFRGRLRFEMGGVHSVFIADMTLTDLARLQSLRIESTFTGRLGTGTSVALVYLAPEHEGTRIVVHTGFDLPGKRTALGQRLLDGAARNFAADLTARLAAHFVPGPPAAALGSTHHASAGAQTDPARGKQRGWLRRLISRDGGGPFGGRRGSGGP